MIKLIPFIYENIDDLYANTYMLVDENNDCVIIDPAKNTPGLVNYINRNCLILKAVLLTHGHIDHIRGVDVLYDAFHMHVYIGFEDLNKLQNPYSNCSSFLGNETIVNAKADAVYDKRVLKCLNEDINVIETPYHTSGSLCFYLPKSQMLFTGDFLFAGSVGRSDLPTAKPRMLRESMAKILALPKETKVYPGHGKSTTLETEMRANPFVK